MEDLYGDVNDVYGYDVEFVNAPEDIDQITCIICLCILKEPIQALCGHRFCRKCFEKINNR